MDFGWFNLNSILSFDWFGWFVGMFKMGVPVICLVGLVIASCIIHKRVYKNQKDALEKMNEIIKNASNKDSENTEEEEGEEEDEIDDEEEDDDDDDEDTYMLLPVLKDSGIYFLRGDISYFYAEGDDYIDDTEGVTVEIIYDSIAPYLVVDNSYDPSRYTFHLTFPEQVTDLSV